MITNAAKWKDLVSSLLRFSVLFKNCETIHVALLLPEGYYIYLSLHCHHQNDSYIKMGSDESHFNVSLIVRDEVTRQFPRPSTLHP